MRLGPNLLAGLANSIWSAIAGFVAVRFYLKYLGIEAYGLIGFFATTQALLSLLDLGLAPTINREVARCSASGNMLEARKLLHTLAVVYWVTAGMIALLIVALAPFIASHWLQSRSISPDILARAMMLMGLVVACRWPIGLYLGALMGMQRLTVSSAINIVMVTLGSLGAVAILAFVSPTVEAFFIWQVGVALLHVAAMRLAAWGVVGREGAGKFDLAGLKRIWRFSAGMSAIAVTGIVFTQLDKVLLSKILGLEEFGHYMLATVVVSGLYIMVTPLFNVMYPRFSVLVVSGDTDNLTQLYRLSIRFLASLLFPAAMLLAVFGEELVLVWTGNSALASRVAPVIAFLSAGSALHGVMYLPYALQLAFGMTRMILRNNIILLAVLVPLITTLSLLYGALGGGVGWFVLHILSTIFVIWQVQRHLLKAASRLFSVDAVTPLVLSFIVGFAGHHMLLSGGYSTYTRLACGAVLALLVSLVSIMSSPELRGRTMKIIGWRSADQGYT